MKDLSKRAETPEQEVLALPSLPYRKVLVFLDALTELSRKHGIYLQMCSWCHTIHLEPVLHNDRKKKYHIRCIEEADLSEYSQLVWD